MNWTEQWHIKHPRWKYRLWREADIARLGLRNQAAYDLYMEAGTWYGAADVARVEILHRFGGVYLDADSEPTRSWEGAPFMDSGFFAAYEYMGRPGHIANGVIGSRRRHPVLGVYIALIGELTNFDPAWDTVGGTSLTRAVEACAAWSDISILPMGTFYPTHHTGMPAGDGVEPWAKQHWASTVGGYPA